MKKLMILVFLISVLLLSSTAIAITCQQAGSFACESTPSSALGFGAVDICDNCHVCGVSDGVCPEDFYDSSATLQGSCLHCPDLDCQAGLNVTVIDQYGDVFGGATVEVQYDYPSVVNPEADTLTTGRVSFPNIYSGHATLLVSDEPSEMIALSQEINLTRGETGELIFTNFSQAACQSDCTRGDGRCHEDCLNDIASGCTISGPLFNFTENAVSQACHLSPNGTNVRLGQEGNLIYFASCCSGPVIETIRPLININDYQDETDHRIIGLVNHVQGALFKSEQIFIVSTFWKFEE